MAGNVYYSFQPIDIANPYAGLSSGGSNTANVETTVTPYDINNSGTIVGSVSFIVPKYGYDYAFEGVSDNISISQYPNPSSTTFSGISTSGEIIGTSDNVSARFSFVLNDGSFSSIPNLPAQIADIAGLLSINDSGDVAGTYYDAAAAANVGFVDIGGQVSTVSLGDNLYTTVAALDNADDYAGTYVAYDPQISDNKYYGYEVIDGVLTTIDVPGASETNVSGMNNLGDVVGDYQVITYLTSYSMEIAEHGFIYHDGNYETVDDPAAPTGMEFGSTYGTFLTGINDLGDVVGYDMGDIAGEDIAGYGFVATPEAMPCYCRGTLLLTDRGERPVEDLRIGDRLVTHAGAARPIRWIGTRSYAGRFAASNTDVLPVLIRAGALGDNVPRRDLFVSPLHAMYLDGMLVPAAALVNGISIIQAKTVDRVDYFHVELDTHDIILAEGAASETFVDDDSRFVFHNAADYRARYPQAARVPARYCAPRLDGGPELDALLQRLQPRIGATPPAPNRLLGNLESVERERIIGWAHDRNRPDHAVTLQILDNGIEIGRVTARRYRADLWEAGFGNGQGGFDFIVPGGLSPLVQHLIEVQHATDGRPLLNSPHRVPAQGEAPPAPWSKAVAAGLDGYIDELTRTRISGWVRNFADPDRPVALQIRDNGVPIARVLANRYRPDLARAKPGAGRCGFELDIPGGLSPLVRHVIEFRREPDGLALGGPPFVIEAATTLDRDVQHAIAAAVDAIGPGAAQQRLLAFFLAQAERLRQGRADTDGQRAERQAQRRAQRRAAPVPHNSAPPASALRALVIDARTPVAGRDAGSQAMLSHMRALQRLGYAVSFAAAEDMAQTPAATAALTKAGITPCRAPFYTSVEDVLRRQAACFDLVYLHRMDTAAHYLALARRYNPRARIVYGVADLHHVRLARQAAIEDRPEVQAASRRARLAEGVAACSANAVITHSSAEVPALRRLAPQANIHRVTWDVPLAQTRIRFAARSGIAFIGAYAHAPNVDAAHWLAETIMPLVWRADPSITCLLVGTDMPRAVRRLARAGIVAVGQVEDLGAAVFDRVRLTVAPLRYGAGINGKILDSLAAGVPCVMSPVAAEGMPLCPTLDTLVGGDAEALATLIRSLHGDRVANARAAAAGLAMIGRDFSAQSVTAALRDAVAGSAMTREPARDAAAA